MWQDYHDIRSKIPEEPQWWDEYAVPRYCAFSACEVADIYADEVVLAEIACQGCGRLFKVAFSWSQCEALHLLSQGHVCKTLAQAIGDKTLHYGDPPNVQCCDAGPTMNSEPRRVLEYWRKVQFDWQRDNGLEVDIVPDWCKDEA